MRLYFWCEACPTGGYDIAVRHTAETGHTQYAATVDGSPEPPC